ncbi:MAG: aminopeptidase [Phycisphaerae bacterium]|nr:aminopeptidase [Phycisphaerae bacterium]
MKLRLRTTLCSLTILGLATISGCGCAEINYMVGAAGGELHLLSSMVPIEQGLTDTSLSEEELAKLDLVIRTRDYAEQTIGLNVGHSYHNFVNLHGGPLAWNLSASRKDAIVPYTWSLPFVGSISYLGYFNLDEAKAERDRLVDQGYDTMIYELDAYSTIGLLPDPLTSAMLGRDSVNLVDTVIHELLHNTIWCASDAVFSESLATFVGRTGALEFLTAEYGPDAAIVHDARIGYEDTDRFNTFLLALTGRLEELYNSSVGSEAKIAARATIFEDGRQRVATELLPTLNEPDRYQSYAEFPFNNAFLMVNGRYNTDLVLFERVHDRTGRDWSASLAVFRSAANSGDPFGFMHSWLGD